MNIRHNTKSISSILVVLTIFLALPANAAYDPLIKYSNGDMSGFVCDVINSIGLGCFFQSPVTNTEVELTTEKDVVYTGTISRKYSNTKISLVRVPGTNQIYEIIKGQKHLIPTSEIFLDYGFKSEMIQTIDPYQLSNYPRATLVRAYNEKKVYYLTEGGMIRFMPQKKVYESYGGREEDVIELSLKEFNYYPKVKYIYLAQPINRDVFIIDGNRKKYLTPMAVMRLVITPDQVTPVNQYEFDYYKTGNPIVY